MEVGQPVQGVSAPLIVQTRIEKVREVRVQPGVYRTIRSFVESSTKPGYEWRTAFEYPGFFVWRKENRWELEVYKKIGPVNFEELPVKGIYKIIDTTISPIAVLKSKAGEIWFVLVNGEVGILYTGRVLLAFTKEAPVAFVPATPLPYSRLIPVYEVLGTLNHYVSF